MGQKKAEKLANKEDFSKELHGFVEKLMAKLTMDMQNKKPVNQSEYYTLTFAKIFARLGKNGVQTTNRNPKNKWPTLRRFC